ncbi:Homeodomain-like DNA binding domain-containing transcription factor [Phycomyces blakesleeanus NRRL 1555(-)]|uniref:Homeodomain-like DNA binding domain-containing transcription factor n=1 Tax=Phycomyces blakesleeanus (strain ATCC 8743b / DSM 1359 / FGSC 10004 / NBRC 33097 / NRRL 1555) TaxID=763407 RepID=A0A162WDP4_PHYB8|nr:Homeodomain-like DNA binding domain-containing transcription factor [Phycomyces blakesleeanus NRRL 1555(-)]OAD66395.1 Homeodomain-like DNA binding domain-containing transcription factor [Phycomyces blakesleeanus NRRL 1555(-)]|eukprot:XP_018284435.1 Homeodomain-like DNA binding domain-containing transcription factor [Phycomyces blakesleeanus NRRL 1555(-)]
MTRGDTTSTLKMGMQFFYEDRQGHVFDERSSEDVYMEQCNKCCYTVYSDDDKSRFFHLFFSKCLNASAAARQLDLHVRAAQKWIKRYYEDPESIFEKKRKSGRRRILGEDHKQFLLNYIDENPSALVIEVTESLTQNFAGLNASHSTIYSFMTTERNHLLSRYSSSL